MQILPTLLVSAVAAFQMLPPTDRLTRSDSVLVTSVLDGRTITVARLGHVRLLGIETPASIAREARDRLAVLVLHRWVRLEQEPTTLDSHRRRLAYIVRDDGLVVNEVLVREGLARVNVRGPLARLDQLKRAEREAQRSRVGLWGRTVPASSRYTRRLRVRETRHATKRNPSACLPFLISSTATDAFFRCERSSRRARVAAKNPRP